MNASPRTSYSQSSVMSGLLRGRFRTGDVQPPGHTRQSALMLLSSDSRDRAFTGWLTVS